MVTRSDYIKHADKSDDVVNIHCVLWSADDGFENDPNNSYFSDLGDEGGYNHFELRHYYRPYSLPGIGENGYAFEKGGRNNNGVQFGDINPSMKFVEQWIFNLEIDN